MLQRVRRLMTRRAPEASIPYRAAVAATVLVSIIAVVLQEAVPVGLGMMAIVGVPTGFILSYHRRAERNVLLKIALALGLFAAFGSFLGGVRGAASVDDTRAPLAALFLWVQVLHSFDVPRRRDLSFSIAASVALIAQAGSLSFSTGFLAVLAPYALCLMVALALGHLSDLREQAGARAAEEVLAPQESATGPSSSTARPARGLWRSVATLGAVTVLATGVVFIGLPRLPGIQLAALPVSLARSSPIGDFAGQVVRPPSSGGGDGGASQRGRGVTGFDPNQYFGYGDRLDLRLRGELSNDLVMRVRSPEPRLWRAQVYDRYDGTAWTSSDTDPRVARSGFDASIRIPSPPERTSGPSHELVQTFYVERDLPNLVFHSQQATEIFVPSSTVHIDAFGSIRMPFLMEKDTIYSVISDVPDRTLEQLRFSPPPDRDDADLARHLQLPDTLGPRFFALADSIAQPHATTAEKVLAVERWLHDNKRYNLDIPPDPEGRDPVEVFLFERDEGFCEQIATSMALLLRAVGIPARLVTGFGEGERNLFTGYWEVRNSDAHAWLEVYYPNIGWVEYDPTFGVPVSDAANTTFMFASLGNLAGDLIPTGAIRDFAGRIGAAVGPAGLAASAIGLVVVVTLLVGVIPRRRRTVQLGSSPRERVIASWLRVEGELAGRGCARSPHETVREFVPRAAVHEGVDADAFRTLVNVFQQTRYGRTGPTASDAQRCEDAASRVVDSLRRTREAVFARRA